MMVFPLANEVFLVNFFVSNLSYIHDSQASLYSLLQAVNEISSRGNYRDEDVNVFVQRRYCVSYLLNLEFDMNPICLYVFAPKNYLSYLLVKRLDFF